MTTTVENLPTRTHAKNGTELDVIEHRRELVWQRGEVRHVKRTLNRRMRRETRQVLRYALA